jgi:hypothetical protein
MAKCTPSDHLHCYNSSIFREPWMHILLL